MIRPTDRQTHALLFEPSVSFILKMGFKVDATAQKDHLSFLPYETLCPIFCTYLVIIKYVLCTTVWKQQGQGHIISIDQTLISFVY